MILLSESLSPCTVPAWVPEQYVIISVRCRYILLFRDSGTLFPGAHICAKKIRYKFSFICARASYLCPWVPILLYIYTLYIISSWFSLVCIGEKAGSQAGSQQGLRDSGVQKRWSI